MSLKKFFRSFVFMSGVVLVLSIVPSAEVSAIAMENHTIPGQDALQEIEQVQEETITIGGEQEEPSVFGEEPEITEIPETKVSIDYNGKIDDSTGEAVVGNAFRVEGDLFILKKDELIYDAKKQMYHNLCGDRGFYSNVPAGAMLSSGNGLQIISDEGVACEVFFEGELIEDPNQTEFQECGEYSVIIYNHADSKERTIYFTILEEYEKDIIEYRLPEGFVLTNVTLDGVKKNIAYNNYYDFLEDGLYWLEWTNSTIGKVYTTEFTLDTKKPTLKLPEVFNGAASGRVSFSDMEKGAYVHWIRDSREEGWIDNPSQELSQKGHYVMRVYDTAGNYTEYAFVLEGYFDVNAILAIIFVIALICGGFLYCRRLRTHMRVG